MLPKALAVCHATFLDGHMVQFSTNRAESLSNDIVVYVITHAVGMIMKTQRARIRRLGTL